MGRAVGIDLGTTYTAIAYVDDFGKAAVIKNIEGQTTTASAVYIDPPHYIVGDVALQSTLTEPERVVQFVKRFIGTKDYRARVDNRSYSPEFISSIVLRKVVQEAQATLGEIIDQAVITVPAHFTEAQRQATYEAGQLAGLKVLRIINEPTAAALSYGLGPRLLSLVNAPAAESASAAPPVNAPVSNGTAEAMHDVAPTPTAPASPTQREVFYRGKRMFVPAMPAAPEPTPVPTSAPVAAPAHAPQTVMYRGKRVNYGGDNGVPAAPVASSSPVPAPTVPINSPLPAVSNVPPRHVLVYDLGGGTFDVTILTITSDALKVAAVGGDAHLGGKDWDDRIMNFIEEQFEEKYGVLLSPDASLEAELRLKAEAAKRQLTGRPLVPITFKTRLSSDDGGRDTIVPVRVDLSRQQFEKITADLLARTELLLETVLSQAELKWEEISEVLCVGGSSKMPMVRELLTRLNDGKQPLLHDPDECIAKGAALQAAILSNQGASPLSISHVLPHALGVAAIKDNQVIIDPIIPALTPLPCAGVREGYTTTRDDQLTIRVDIYEGESTDPDAYAEGPIGAFELDVSPPRPKGKPRILVELRCDENARIMVLARDQDTGKESRTMVMLDAARSQEETDEETMWIGEAIIA